MKKRGLGRGLNDLGIGELLSNINQPTAPTTVTASNHGVAQLPIEFLQPSPMQPRRVFDETALTELADSIRAQGLIQPIVVRKQAENHYEIIAGERRTRAAKIAGLTEVPVVVKEVSDEAALAIALIENIQREDLNAIEEAQALKKLQQQFDLTHEAVAEAVGKSRSMVTNLMRLLQLDDRVQHALANSQLEMGHARALLALDQQKQWTSALIIINKKMSVREAEEFIRRQQQPKTHQPTKMQASEAVKQMEQRIANALGLKTSIRQLQSGKGKLVINYRKFAELESLLEKLTSG